MLIQEYLGIDKLPVLTQGLFKKYLIIALGNSFILSISSTFYILLVIDQIGFAMAGVMTAVFLLVQMILDYPSGSLSDWIGHRWVLAIGYLGYAIGYLMLVSAESLSNFLIVAVIMGIASAQLSGTLSSWLDNNYQKTVKDADPDRKIYGFSVLRVQTLDRFFLAGSFLLGGFLATNLSRRFVFFVQAICVLILLVFVLIFVRNIITEEDILESSTKSRSLIDYFSYLKGGISFLFSSKPHFFFLMGYAIYDVTWNIWGNLILYPLYFGYTGSDSIAGVLRTIIFLSGTPIRLYMANFSKKLSRGKFAFLYFLHLILFMPSVFFLLYLVPPSNSFNFIGSIVIILIMVIINSTVFQLAFILRQRITIELVPSENRTAVYSLLPTLSGMIAIPMLSIAGLLIEDNGLSTGILIAFSIGMTGTFFSFLSLYFLNMQKKKGAPSSIRPSKVHISR
ncbi:MAG: MFS transporter [Candidatus Hodarchaeales archaeon]